VDVQKRGLKHRATPTLLSTINLIQCYFVKQNCLTTRAGNYLRDDFLRADQDS
jgi:hypothetical protein